MARAVTVLVSTLLFGLFGLLVGWLNINAQIQTIRPGYGIPTDSLLFSYGIAPLVGAAIGFVLAVVAMKWFATSNTHD